MGSALVSSTASFVASPQKNMPSAAQCEVRVAEFLTTECVAGWIIGPLSHDIVPMVHVNRLGAVPNSTPGKYRFVLPSGPQCEHWYCRGDVLS